MGRRPTITGKGLYRMELRSLITDFQTGRWFWILPGPTQSEKRSRRVRDVAGGGAERVEA